MNTPSMTARWRAASIAAGVLVGLVALYAAAGGWLLPWLVKRELPASAAEKWNARARVDEVRFNPFTLRLRVAGFVLEERDGRPLLAIREAQADLEWRSLTRRALVLSDLRVVEPVARVEISEKGRLNFATLGGAGSGQREASGPPAVDLANVTVENGRVDFEDRREGYKNRFERLSLKLSSVSTVKDDKGPYDLVAQTPDGGKLRWKGEISVTPLALTGTLIFEHGVLAQLNPYLDDHTAARITSGRARLELPHRFALVDGKPQIAIHGARLAVEELALAVRGAERPFATVARLALEGVEADLGARRASAKLLNVAGFSASARRDAQGGLLPKLGAESRARGQGKEGNAAAWQLGIAEVSLSGGAVALADEATGSALELGRITARASAVSSDLKRPVAFEASAALGDGGRLAARGSAVPAGDRLEANVEVAGVPLALLQPFLGRRADIKIVSGQFAGAGELAIGRDAGTRRGRAARLAYAGSAALENVVLRDAAGAPLVQWRSLSTKSLNLTLGPDRARIDELRLSAPRGRLEIAADGTTNLGRLMRGERAAAPAGGRKRPPGSAPAPEEQPGQTARADGDQADDEGRFPIRIRRVQVEGGTLTFSDQSLSPNFKAVIRELAGTVNGLSTDRNTRSQIALEGRVNEFGHARISGTLNPFAPRERTVFRVQFRNLDLAGVSPYTIKFAGYRVASGRLNLDLNYRVQNNRLEGDNHVVLDNFTLGERVGEGISPGLPLELAVALLKDENGRIDVGVPISGSLDDPDFKLGDVFWRALGNIVRNIVTAPFRALGRLFGGGSEELAAIAFEPGASRLLPPEREKFGRIAEGLAKRPELKVVVPARYDEQADARALKREALRRELAKRAGFDVGADDPAGPVSLDDRRVRRALRELYAQRIGEPELARLKEEAEREAASSGGRSGELSVVDRIRNFAAGEPQVADASAFYRSLYRGLLESQPIAEGALAELAKQRAAAITSALQAAGVAPDRVAQASAEPTSSAGAKQVTIQLTLAPGG